MKRTALCALLVIGACGITQAIGQRDEAARDGAIQWLQLLDAGRYDEAASQVSLEARALEQWLQYFKAHRTSLGHANKRELVDSKHTSVFPGVPDVRRYHVLRFKTWFENPPSSDSGAANKSAVIEQVTIAKMGCCWEIFGYQISDKEVEKLRR